VAEPWVINASPVILLAKAGVINLVPHLAKPLVIPQPVADEICQSRLADAAVDWIKGVGGQFVRPAAAELAGLSQSDIGPGERSVISWAVANLGFVAILDDRMARNMAMSLGVRALGTVGVILELKKSGLINEVKPHLSEIRRVGGFMSDALFREALRRAGET
jgi:predicted nucleic acid-binding protein